MFDMKDYSKKEIWELYQQEKRNTRDNMVDKNELNYTLAHCREKLKDYERKSKSSTALTLKYLDEVHLMYRKSIGLCTTPKEVVDVLNRYIKLHNMGARKKGNANFIPDVLSFAKLQREPRDGVIQAAATKIKRLFRDRIDHILVTIKGHNNSVYSSIVAELIKDISGKDIDPVKVIEAKKAGLDSKLVIQSIMAQYNIDQDGLF